MQHKIRLAVLGGTGKAGKYLVKKLLNQGYPIRLLARNPEAIEIKSPQIEVARGDARKFESIHSLLKGCMPSSVHWVNRKVKPQYLVRLPKISSKP
ncbi:MAG: NAD(P)H-binding protein [Flammeovirgaceae bacterium]